MTSIAVYVTITEEFLEVYEEICERVPCWTDMSMDEDFLHIMCRDEDAAFVERILSPFV